jgi:hypothetical protein
MLCSVAIAGIVPHLLKWVVACERPDRTRIHGAFDRADDAGSSVRRFVWPIAAALAGTRIVLLAHYLSDVIAGLWRSA